MANHNKKTMEYFHSHSLSTKWGSERPHPEKLACRDHAAACGEEAWQTVGGKRADTCNQLDRLIMIQFIHRSNAGQ
ncbi:MULTISPECIES: hypothetical protein [unclassified Peribacillus]|uniref:hypothetical protein n=1 Tax=unclassified Peribacillus TaxID=2675266 RepID=UPI00367211C3